MHSAISPPTDSKGESVRVIAFRANYPPIGSRAKNLNDGPCSIFNFLYSVRRFVTDAPREFGHGQTRQPKYLCTLTLWVARPV
jgi:hypothetical protein